MSKKSFILMALVVNLTICLTLCIVLFTDNDKTNTNNKTKAESSMSQEIKKLHQTITWILKTLWKKHQLQKRLQRRL